jgi:HAD superfamily hydrolase (TIGR01490 family)
MNLALFDFDGTISSKDSFLLFLWEVDKYRFLITCIRYFHPVILYLLKCYPKQKLKEIFISGILMGKNINELNYLADNFCQKTVPLIIRDKFWKRLQYHQDRRHTIVVVTATPCFILEPWCRLKSIQILGSELEFDNNGFVTGKLDGDNCMGEEKVRRIQEEYDMSQYEEIFVYGDSSSDQPMLRLATLGNSFFKPFR